MEELDALFETPPPRDPVSGTAFDYVVDERGVRLRFVNARPGADLDSWTFPR